MVCMCVQLAAVRCMVLNCWPPASVVFGIRGQHPSRQFGRLSCDIGVLTAWFDFRMPYGSDWLSPWVFGRATDWILLWWGLVAICVFGTLACVCTCFQVCVCVSVKKKYLTQLFCLCPCVSSWECLWSVQTHVFCEGLPLETHVNSTSPLRLKLTWLMVICGRTHPLATDQSHVMF